MNQGRNFGLKSGATNSEGERGALGSRDERRGEWGGDIPLLIWLWGLGQRHEPQPKIVLLYFILRRSILLTAGDSKFFIFLSWKVRGTVPLSPKSGGTGTPRTPVNYAYMDWTQAQAVQVPPCSRPTHRVAPPDRSLR